ncbi:MAG: hypothetical protein NT003_04440 [Candidatus Magasanikbacteria bacterium]|nr:hypothetical protein [Candidatus Magasanikbacteria bacterium]
MMQDALKTFPQQFDFVPVIHNHEKLPQDNRPVILCGMGGSHLSADIFNVLAHGRIRAIHMDYGLPHITRSDLHGALLVMSSYSGNTEEVLEAYDAAKEAGYTMCAMAVGGKLLERAAADGIPYIQFPNVGIQPRAALGYGVVALASLLHERSTLEELHTLKLDVERARMSGEMLAEKLRGKIPLIYSSSRNGAIAQNWKIKFCENTKIPAFWNSIPELNHNEMTGFDAIDSTRELSKQISVIILMDAEDHPCNRRRCEITAELYKERGIEVTTIELSGASRAERIFSSLMIADWTSVLLGEFYGVETEQVPMVEEFKKAIA